MKALPQHEITHLLRAWSDGRVGPADQLMPRVYEQLHRLARSYMVQERADHTLRFLDPDNEANEFIFVAPSPKISSSQPAPG